MDPLASKYPSLSGYCYVGGNPIVRVDPIGMNDVTVNEDGEVIHVNETKDSHKLVRQNNDGTQTVLQTNDPNNVDNALLDKTKVGQQLVYTLSIENVNYIMNDAGALSFLGNIPELYAFIKGAATSRGGALDFGNSVIRPQVDESNKDTGVHPDDKYDMVDNANVFILFEDTGKDKVYNIADAGNFLWGHAMTRMGGSNFAMYAGSNLNEAGSGGDTVADQQAIRDGSNFAYRITDPISNLFGYPQSKPTWFKKEGNSYGR